jgi:macrophage erythroblast attacher
MLTNGQDQPLLRMPYELSRRNFKNAQRLIEHSTTSFTSSLQSTTKAASKTNDSTQTLESLDAMITKMQGLKRKLSNLQEEEERLHKAAKARLQHLQDLHEVQSLVDVKYDEWSRVRLSRLLVDYLLREGYADSAACLARSKGIEDLVDVDAFVACHKIERSLKEGQSTALALEWCKEHNKELKKGGSMLEFELRLQQYIEMVRTGHESGVSGMDGEFAEGVRIGEGGGETKLMEARAHAKKYLSGSGDFELLGRAAGLLAYRPWDEVEPYAVSPYILPKHTMRSLLHIQANVHHSPSTPQPAGHTSLPYSSRPTTPSTPYLPAHSSTSPSPRASAPSKPPPVTPPSPPAPPTAPPRPQPYVPFAAPSSTSSHVTCPMRTTPRVSSRTIPWCCPMDASTGARN